MTAASGTSTVCAVDNRVHHVRDVHGPEHDDHPRSAGLEAGTQHGLRDAAVPPQCSSVHEVLHDVRHRGGERQVPPLACTGGHSSVPSIPP